MEGASVTVAEMKDLSTNLSGRLILKSDEAGNKVAKVDEGPNKVQAHPDVGDTFLYEPSLLASLSFKGAAVKFTPPIPSPSQPGPGLRVRPLSSGDFDRGYLRLLGQLTNVGSVSKLDFMKKFAKMRSCPNTYFITVVVDTERDEVVGAGTLVKEEKFIHDCGVRGIIEDIVVSDQYRGKQLGKLVVGTLIELGKHIGCYKITLNCKDNLVKFYNGFGLAMEPNNANFMQVRVQSKL